MLVCNNAPGGDYGGDRKEGIRRAGASPVSALAQKHPLLKEGVLRIELTKRLFMHFQKFGYFRTPQPDGLIFSFSLDPQENRNPPFRWKSPYEVKDIYLK